MDSCFALVPKSHHLTSVEAFRDSIINNKPFQEHYLDDLSELYKTNPEDWHVTFMEYHNLRDEYGEIAIALISNGFWIDDIQFILPNHRTAVKLVP